MRRRSRPRSVRTRTRSPFPPSATRSMRPSPGPVPTISSLSQARSTRQGKPLTTSASARSRIGFLMRDLSPRYLPAGDLRAGRTPLSHNDAVHEDPFSVLILTILSQRTRDEMTELVAKQHFAKDLN